VKRWRLKRLKAGWRGRVRICGHNGHGCAWLAAGAPSCDCVAGSPCRCEIALWDAAYRAARASVGEAAASLTASAHLALMRRQLVEEDESDRTTELRLRLLRLTLQTERHLRREDRAVQRLALERERDRAAAEREAREREGGLDLLAWARLDESRGIAGTPRATAEPPRPPVQK
jgi:hypothetical protein